MHAAMGLGRAMAVVAVAGSLTLTACTPPPAAPAPVATPPVSTPSVSPTPADTTPEGTPPADTTPADTTPADTPPAGTTPGNAPPGTGTPSLSPSAPAGSASVVVLDPGHNGGNAAHPAEINRPVPDGRGGTKSCNTTGTATDAGYPEHAFTFDVALRVQKILTAAGVRVVLTRASDTGVGPCVDVRGTAGRRADATAVVSIHADGAAASGSGFHVALSAPPLNAVQAGPAHVLGTALRDAFRAAGFHDSTYLGNQGISQRPDLAGLNFATRPTALVECANMRNPAEAAIVSSPDGRQRYAAALASGILAFLHQSR